MDPKEIEKLIQKGLPESEVEVRTDGQGHYEALIVSSVFDGKWILSNAGNGVELPCSWGA